jgi:xanthine dehydrogenase small subunit
MARLLLANPNARIVAGATDIGLWVTKQCRFLPISIHIGRVRTLARVAHVDERLLLGAGLTHTEAMQAIGTRFEVLRELWRRFAGVQVRNVGTIGGNIANGSPIGDLAPALIALGAVLHLRRGADRRMIPIEDFFISYGTQDLRSGEFITCLELPAPITNADLSIHKISKRFDDDISAVCGAFNIHVAGGTVVTARIAFGGMAATPKRARAVEAALVGRPWTRVTIDEAVSEFGTDFSPIGDVRASAIYRMEVARNTLIRTFIERTAPNVATRLVGAVRWADR